MTNVIILLKFTMTLFKSTINFYYSFDEFKMLNNWGVEKLFLTRLTHSVLIVAWKCTSTDAGTNITRRLLTVLRRFGSLSVLFGRCKQQNGQAPFIRWRVDSTFSKQMTNKGQLNERSSFDNFTRSFYGSNLYDPCMLKKFLLITYVSPTVIVPDEWFQTVLFWMTAILCCLKHLIFNSRLHSTETLMPDMQDESEDTSNYVER